MDIEMFRRRYPERKIKAGGFAWGVIRTNGRKGAPTLVLIPGTLGTAELFFNQIVALGRQLRIVALTVPDSEHIHRLADGLATLMDKLGIASASILGSSLGGYLIQHFAARHPKRVNTLFVANTLLDPAKLKARGRSLDDFRRMTPKQHQVSSEANILALPAPDRGFRLMKELLLHNNRRLGGKTLKARVLIVRGGPPVPKLSIPQNRIVTLDCGDDPVVPPSVLAAVRRRYPKAEHFRMQVGGHFPYISRPKAYIDLIRRRLLGDGR